MTSTHFSADTLFLEFLTGFQQIENKLQFSLVHSQFYPKIAHLSKTLTFIRKRHIYPKTGHYPKITHLSKTAHLSKSSEFIQTQHINPKKGRLFKKGTFIQK